MTDKLKQFIDDNRESFDSEIPSPKLFDRIRKEAGAPAKHMRWLRPVIIGTAAALILFLALGIALYNDIQKERYTETAGRNEPDIEKIITVAEPLYAKQIDRYEELIGLQQTELRKVEKEQPELYRQFANDINLLDSAYEVLRAKLPDNPNREILLEAMISNLQLQTELLNRQLSIIKEIKQKSKAHEKDPV